MVRHPRSGNQQLGCFSYSGRTNSLRADVEDMATGLSQPNQQWMTTGRFRDLPVSVQRACVVLWGADPVDQYATRDSVTHYLTFPSGSQVGAWIRWGRSLIVRSVCPLPANASSPSYEKPVHDSGPRLAANLYHGGFNRLLFVGFYLLFWADPNWLNFHKSRTILDRGNLK